MNAYLCIVAGIGIFILSLLCKFKPELMMPRSESGLELRMLGIGACFAALMTVAYLFGELAKSYFL